MTKVQITIQGGQNAPTQIVFETEHSQYTVAQAFLILMSAGKWKQEPEHGHAKNPDPD